MNAQRDERCGDRTAKQGKPEEIEQPPNEQESRFGDQIDFARGHDGQCGHMQDCHSAERCRIAPGNPLRWAQGG